jgi:hypothetical protein
MYTKVSIRIGGTMHIEHGDKTLCGRRWHFEASHGYKYCKQCQRIYAYRVKASGLAPTAFFELNKDRQC